MTEKNDSDEEQDEEEGSEEEGSEEEDSDEEGIPICCSDASRFKLRIFFSIKELKCIKVWSCNIF